MSKEQQVAALWGALRTLSGETLRSSMALSQRSRGMTNEALTTAANQECDVIYRHWKATRRHAGLDDFREFYRAILKRSLEIVEMQ